mmetsp:Transcript_62161/g.111964  ORF Transcript_62161/g.111964 Transcript_62161/m.111964 type:complete len:240 (-) Transcript_62161:966-1685(-)
MWPKEIPSIGADAGLANRAEKNLVHAFLVVAELSHDTLHDGSASMRVQALQENGARHLVRLQTTGLHLIHEGPGSVGAGSQRGIDELVECDVVGLQPRSSHRRQNLESALEVATLKMALDHGVVGDHISQSCSCGLLHDFAHGGSIARAERGIQKCVVEASRLLGTRLEEPTDIVQALAGTEALEQTDLARLLTILQEQLQDIVTIQPECRFGHDSAGLRVSCKNINVRQVLRVMLEHF